VDDSEKRAFSVAEAARLLGLSRNSTYQAVHSGVIPSIRVEGRILIPKVALDKWLSCDS
jgi:excisionase family DNA binding protein